MPGFGDGSFGTGTFGNLASSGGSVTDWPFTWTPPDVGNADLSQPASIVASGSAIQAIVATVRSGGSIPVSLRNSDSDNLVSAGRVILRRLEDIGSDWESIPDSDITSNSPGGVLLGLIKYYSA